MKRSPFVLFLSLDLFSSHCQLPSFIEVDFNNQITCIIPNNVNGPVNVKIELTVGSNHLESTNTCQPGVSCTITIRPPSVFPTGPGTLMATGTGALNFQETKSIVAHDMHIILLIQPSASTYRPGDTMVIRVVATDENLIPLSDKSVDIEIYV